MVDGSTSEHTDCLTPAIGVKGMVGEPGGWMRSRIDRSKVRSGVTKG